MQQLKITKPLSVATFLRKEKVFCYFLTVHQAGLSCDRKKFFFSNDEYLITYPWIYQTVPTCSMYLL